MNKIFSINGPVIKVKDTDDFSMLEMVYAGEKKLVGEVISVSADETTIQVYESTTGLRPGEPVQGSGMPMSAVLGPGILSNIFDGIERPLRKLEEESGAVTAYINGAEGDVGPRLTNGKTKSFGDIKAVQDLSFKVKEGELFAFLGINGAGKSTTISIMCGQLAKDNGAVTIDKIVVITIA